MNKKQYQKGYDEALQYVIERGEKLLQSGKLTPDMAMGISLILGIAKAKMEELRRGENGREIKQT